MTTTTLHIAEFRDDQGSYCKVWLDGAADGDEAEYPNLEAAAWALERDAAKTGERFELLVHADDAEFARFERARREAQRWLANIARRVSAPRDKLTGRALFVRL